MGTQPGAGPGTYRQPGVGAGTYRQPGAFRGRGTTTPGVTRTPNAFAPRTTTPGGTTGRIGRPGTPATTPGAITGRGNRGAGQGTLPGGRGTPGAPNGRRGGPGGRGPTYGPGQARDQWHHAWNQGHNNWHHNGNWSHNNNWGWNNSNFYFGLYFYPGFGFGLGYGYWGFGGCDAYCTYSPFYAYGFPYIYAPRVVVEDVPVYTYTPVPAYDYGGYYMSQGAYSGLDSAINDIRTAWTNGRADLLLKHVDTNTQIAIFLDGNYSYSIPGSDYSNMIRDAIGRVRTISLTFDNVEQRSDGAYTVTGVHQFYDLNGDQKSANVSFTLAQQGGRWIIVAAGSTENA